MDLSQRTDCSSMSAYDYQRQTYFWNYLDGTQRGNMGDKPRTQSPTNECYSAELSENQTLQIKTPYSLSREHVPRSMAVANWGSPMYPRYGLPYCDATRGYSENVSPSCMFSAPRTHYQQFVNHARTQVEWIHDLTQDPTMRSRPSFTSHQTRELEREFNNCQYISRRRRIEIAFSLNLSEKQIKTWFQNRRVKERKTRKPPETK